MRHFVKMVWSRTGDTFFGLDHLHVNPNCRSTFLNRERLRLFMSRDFGD